MGHTLPTCPPQVEYCRVCPGVEGSARDLMKFSRNESKVLPWGRRRTPGVPLGWTDGGSSAEKCLGAGKQLTEYE